MRVIGQAVRQGSLNPIEVMVARQVAAERKKAGRSVAAFCQLINIDELKYRRFESARERIDARSLQKISLVLGVSPVVFFMPPPSIEGEYTQERKRMI